MAPAASFLNLGSVGSLNGVEDYPVISVTFHRGLTKYQKAPCVGFHGSLTQDVTNKFGSGVDY